MLKVPNRFGTELSETKVSECQEHKIFMNRIDNSHFSKHNRAEKKNEPFGPVPRSINKALCDVFLRLSKVLEFQSSSRSAHRNDHTACYWRGPGFRRIHKLFSCPFLVLASLSNMFFSRRGKNVFTICVPSFPFHFHFLCFPFLVLSFSLLSFPICFVDCLEKTHSQIAFLTCPFPFSPCPCFPFQCAFWMAWKKHLHKLHSFPFDSVCDWHAMQSGHGARSPFGPHACSPTRRSQEGRDLEDD